MRHRILALLLVANAQVALSAQTLSSANPGTSSRPPVAVTQGWLKGAQEPSSHEFRRRSQGRDSKGQTIQRYDHYFKGIRILKSEGLVCTDDGGNVHRSAYAYGQMLEPRGLDLTAAFPANRALELVKAVRLKTKVGWIQPTVELAIDPVIESFRKEGSLPVYGDLGPASNAQAYGRELKGYRLVYLTHAWDPLKQDVMGHKVDAKTGGLIESFRTSSCASGIAQGLYNPNTPIPVTQVGASYSLSSGIISTWNAGGGLYAKASPIFGDGQVYAGNPFSLNGETAAADAYFGATTAFTFYQNVFGRNGIDGYSVPIYVHDSSIPGNAYAHWYQSWDTSYSYWISFGDAGSSLGSMTDTDIVAHEWSHLVNYRSAQVGRDGGTIEQKAIDEANSDILAAFAKIWSRNGKGSSVGYSDPSNRASDWVNGGRVVWSDKGGSSYYYCIRDLAWPSDVGLNKSKPPLNPSQSWYVGSTSWPDGHYGTGPIARGMYLLAQGLDPYVGLYAPNRQWTSPFLPLGMQGIGPDAAAQIWYWALTHYFTSNMSYPFLWSGLEFAAIDLYGRGSVQHQAVNNALTAVNIAAPWPTTDLTYDVEPNDTQAQATVLPLGHRHHVNAGQISPNGDVDWYQVTVPAGHTASIWVRSQIPSSGVPTESATGFEFRDSNGATQYMAALIIYPHPIRHIDDPPPPTPDYYETQAHYDYKNTGTSVQTVYLKIRQGTADALGANYALDVRDWIFDVAYQSGLASSW